MTVAVSHLRVVPNGCTDDVGGRPPTGSRAGQRVRDIPLAGAAVVLRRGPARWGGAEATAQLPPLARNATRLLTALGKWLPALR
jgi:hypothetical protein